MNYLLNFNTFNEGLFTDYEKDVDIANFVYNKVLSDFRKITITKYNAETFVLRNLKLDDNIGLYDITISKGILKLRYFVDDVTKFNYELNCPNSIKKNLFNLAKRFYRE